jgi:hypothetical protein
MRMRHRAWLRRLRILVLPACALALAAPASAPAAPSQDLRSPDARDAAQATSPARVQTDSGPARVPTDSGPARSARVIESTGSGDQTVAIALASAAIAIALAGLAVALGALLRRPRTRWSVS